MTSFLRRLNGLRRRTRLPKPDPFTFFNGKNLVGLDVCKVFPKPAGPAHFNPIHFGSIPQTKVKSKVVLRKVAAATPHFVGLFVRSCGHGYSGSNSLPVRFGSDESK